MRTITQNEKETLDLGRNFAQKLKGGEVLALFGDLGAGKTTFAKGIATGLGISKTITSPTFNIMKVYPINNKAIKQLVHIDAYRLASSLDAEEIGLVELMADPSNIFIVEWPENIWDLLKERASIINFKFMDDSKREIRI